MEYFYSYQEYYDVVNGRVKVEAPKEIKKKKKKTSSKKKGAKK